MPNYFKMGVAAPIRNPKFRYGEELRGTLSAALNTTGNLTFSLTDKATSPGWNQVFRAGDILQLGPSTHDDNPGAKEFVTVDAIVNSPGSITVQEPAGNTFKYNVLDPINGLGTNLPRFWRPHGTNDALALATNFDGIFSDFGPPVSIREFPGTSDPFRVKIDGATTQKGISYLLTSNSAIIPRTLYRVGFHYKVSWTGGTSANYWTFGLSDDNGVTNFLTGLFASKSAGDKTVWTSYLSPLVTTNFSAPGTLGVSSDDPTTLLLYFMTSLGGGGSTTLQLDCPYVCHAQGTTSYAEGIYEFEWLPDLGSVGWEDHLDRKSISDGLNIERYFDPTNRLGRSSRHSISCHYTHAPQSMWEVLQQFDWWQSQGYSLVFVTGEAGYGNYFPAVMTGKMELSNYQRNMWDQRRVSFNFTFIED